MKEFRGELTASVSLTVGDADTAASVKSGSLPVLATPVLVALMEEAACKAVLPLLEEGETTVGTSLDISHSKASGLGETVTAYAALEAVDGRKLTFTVRAQDSAGDTVGSGTHERFAVDAARFMKRVKG